MMGLAATGSKYALSKDFTQNKCYRVFNIENDAFHVNMLVILRLNATGSKHAVLNKYTQNKGFSCFWHRKRRFSCEFARNNAFKCNR